MGLPGRACPPPLQLPRRPTPRTVVPAGSVAIASEFTGVYPTASPGGWHLLGHTIGDDVRCRPAQAGAGRRRRPGAIRATHDRDRQLRGSAARSRISVGPAVQHLGVGRSGAVDRPSHRLANRLVGNAESAATIETYGGLCVRGTSPRCRRGHRCRGRDRGASWSADGGQRRRSPAGRCGAHPAAARRRHALLPRRARRSRGRPGARLAQSRHPCRDRAAARAGATGRRRARPGTRR